MFPPNRTLVEAGDLVGTPFLYLVTRRRFKQGIFALNVQDLDLGLRVVFVVDWEDRAVRVGVEGGLREANNRPEQIFDWDAALDSRDYSEMDMKAKAEAMQKDALKIARAAQKILDDCSDVTDEIKEKVRHIMAPERKDK